MTNVDAVLMLNIFGVAQRQKRTDGRHDHQTNDGRRVAGRSERIVQQRTLLKPVTPFEPDCSDALLLEFANFE